MEESGTVGNQALQDQRMAMLFVHRNILQFGGSLDKVMVFGQSAGAMIVCYHYATTASRGLFSAAIMQSGTCDISGLLQKLATPSNFPTAYAVGLGCDQPPGQARLSCLRNLSATDVLLNPPDGPEAKADAVRRGIEQMSDALLADTRGESHSHQQSYDGELELAQPLFTRASREEALRLSVAQAVHGSWPLLDPSMPYGPVVDGTSEGLPAFPLELIESPDFVPDVPLLIGTNRNDGTIFTIYPT